MLSHANTNASTFMNSFSVKLNLNIFNSHLCSITQPSQSGLYHSLLFYRHSFAPLSSDYLQPRAGPLSIEFYEGSVTQPDPSTRGFDLVTCIEL